MCNLSFTIIYYVFHLLSQRVEAKQEMSSWLADANQNPRIRRRLLHKIQLLGTIAPQATKSGWKTRFARGTEAAGCIIRGIFIDAGWPCGHYLRVPFTTAKQERSSLESKISANEPRFLLARSSSRWKSRPRLAILWYTMILLSRFACVKGFRVKPAKARANGDLIANTVCFPPRIRSFSVDYILGNSWIALNLWTWRLK